VIAPLSQLDRDVLTFAAEIEPHLTRDGRERTIVRDLVGVTYELYAQRLSHLLDDPRSLAIDGPGVMFLRRQRDARTARRLPRRRLADHPLPARADTHVEVA